MWDKTANCETLTDYVIQVFIYMCKKKNDHISFRALDRWSLWRHVATERQPGLSSANLIRVGAVHSSPHLVSNARTILVVSAVMVGAVEKGEHDEGFVLVGRGCLYFSRSCLVVPCWTLRYQA